MKKSNTKESAIQVLLESGAASAIRELKIGFAEPDPKFGIWKLKQKATDTHGWIVWLAGYPDPYGYIRDGHDVCEFRLKLKKNKKHMYK